MRSKAMALRARCAKLLRPGASVDSESCRSLLVEVNRAVNEVNESLSKSRDPSREVEAFWVQRVLTSVVVELEEKLDELERSRST